MYGQGQGVPRAALTGSSRWIQAATLGGMGLQPQWLPEASTGLSWLLAAARAHLSPFLQDSPKCSLHSEAIGLLPRPPFLVKGYRADPCRHVSLPGFSMFMGLPTLEVTNAVDLQQNSTTSPLPIAAPTGRQTWTSLDSCWFLLEVRLVALWGQGPGCGQEAWHRQRMRAGRYPDSQ